MEVDGLDDGLRWLVKPLDGLINHNIVILADIMTNHAQNGPVGMLATAEGSRTLGRPVRRATLAVWSVVKSPRFSAQQPNQTGLFAGCHGDTGHTAHHTAPEAGGFQLV